MCRTDIGLERTPAGRRLVVAREVDASPDAAWKLLTDTERWPEWGPSVRAVESSSRVIDGETTGRVRVPGGLWVPFEVTSCVDRRWTWRVARIPATGHFVDERPEGCRVGFELSVVAAGYAPVCARALGHIETLLTEERA
ncbi:SRPBCC family protein [Salinibaculum rarum]|uniref:SRPBCC family protein n=1 Tax=Salinibaculum rarum TaxID=3058903 RepID=UPI00265E16A2|nr:SRPBCC family protein [Salinibaculum sp. KK48]